MGHYRKALNQFERVLGKKLKLRGKSLKLINKEIFELFFFKKNLSIYSEIEKKIFRTTDHPNVAITLGHIAAQWSRMGEYQKALDLFERVLGKKYSKRKF